MNAMHESMSVFGLALDFCQSMDTAYNVLGHALDSIRFGVPWFISILAVSS